MMVILSLPPFCKAFYSSFSAFFFRIRLKSSEIRWLASRSMIILAVPVPIPSRISCRRCGSSSNPAVVLAGKLSASLHDAIFYHFDDVYRHGFASWFYWFKGNSVRNPTSSKPSQGDRSIGAHPLRPTANRSHVLQMHCRIFCQVHIP